MRCLVKSSISAAAVVALVVAGCSSHDESGSTTEPTSNQTQAAPSSIVRIKDKGVVAKGGTVYVVQTADFDSLDPANNYNAQAQEAGRLIYRTLTFVKDTPGEEPSIQPDLAEALGTPSDDGRTWTYHLRAGLKYEDGRPIIAQDIKYGVMRNFASDVFTLGATWMPDLLKNDTGYKGPYATPEKDLTSVETPDDRTLILHFTGPQPDADWIMSLPYASPVPRDRDTKEAYGERPIASGPYKVESYRRGGSLALIRNENWDAATDPNRPAYPDRFQFELVEDKAAASRRLLEGTGNDAYAVPLGGVLSPSAYPKLEDPSLKPRFVNGPGACVDYVSMNTQKIKDVDVRHAIALSINRNSILDNAGGAFAGSIADSIVLPSLPGYAAPDLGLAPTGNPDAAKKLLEGKSVPPLHLLISGSSSVVAKEAESIQANLKAVGLEVILDPRPDEEHAAILDSDDAPELSDTGSWCFDWPTPASMILPLLGPNSDGTSWGSNNASKYFDPKFSAQLRELSSSPEDSAAVDGKFVQVANEIQTTAWPILPTIVLNCPDVVGSNVTNVGTSPVFSSVDLNTLAVKK